MTLFRRAKVGILMGTIALFLGSSDLTGGEDFTVTKVLTVSDSQVISILGRQTATTQSSLNPLLLAPYKDLEIFISKKQEADFEFTSVGLAWDEIIPELGHGTTIAGDADSDHADGANPGSAAVNVQAEMKFKIDGRWTDWIEMEEEPDPIKPGKKYAMGSTDPAEAFQYKFILYSDGTVTPLVQNTEWTFIRAGQSWGARPEGASLNANTSPFAEPKFSALLTEPTPTYLAATSATTINTNIIPRSAWGADESYRYLSDNSITPQLVEMDEEWYERFASELRYSRVVEADEFGNKYKWPLQYPEQVEKVIIHHTATTSNLDNPAQAIRDIYYYHAVTRGWGDIGYNYIVDQNGRVYEGRYGGEGMIGAHSGPGNHGSIGIAVLGNFQNTDIAQKIIVSLSQFIYKKARIHGFSADGFSDFRAELMPNIFGHRDIMSTQCPGDFLYAKLPILRTLATTNLTQKEKFVKKYAFQDLTELYYLELKPQETKDVELRIENIGTINWDDRTFIVVDENPEFNGVVSFPTQEGVVLAMMEEDLVEPGETATFKFQVRADMTAKTVQMDITPLINGSQKLTEYIVLPVTVQSPVYKFEFEGAKYPPALMQSGDEFDGYVKLKNTGNVIWRKNDGNKVRLEVSSGSSGGSAIFGSPTFAGPNLQENSVAPGSTGTFKFKLTAGGGPGYFDYSFTPKIDGGTFINSAVLSFATVVYKRELDGSFVSKTLLNEWQREKPYTVSLKLRNIGSRSWHEDDLKVVFMKDRNLKISGLQLSPTTVEIGQMGTISFTVKAKPAALLGEKNMLINPQINDKQLTVPVLLKYTVKEKQFQSDSASSQKIRVKISFSGDPQITASGSFEVYSGENLLATLNAGEIATVEKDGSGYRIQADDAVFTSTDFPRFVPKNSAILKIKNFEHRPSWNLALNDNEYRGVLEARDTDDVNVDGDGNLTVINELPLEDYLKGLGELPDSEHPEKIKAIMIAARSYAHYYMTLDEKFPGKPYHLDDDPNVSQKYLGYGFEKRAPNIVEGVEMTYGKILTYNGTVIKAPYFSQSDGTRTKSALEVWGWDFAPYLVSVDDSFCDGDEFLGHGVGMSGCGARGMAEQGYNYEEILKHYYTGIEIAPDFGQ